jgi:hypothetical protein
LGLARRISQTTNRKWISYLERRFAFDNKRANLNPFEEGGGHSLKVQFSATHPYHSIEEKEMNTFRKTAIIAGVVFIIATAAGLICNAFTGSMNAPDYLVQLAANQNQVKIGVLFLLVAAFGSASIAIVLYPVLRKFNAGLALGSVGFRLIESVFYIVAVVGLLSLLSLSQQYVAAGASNAPLYQVSGAVLLAIKKWAGQLGVIAFTMGAMMYYTVFYQSKLAPRWISVFGILAAISSLTAVLLTLFDKLVPFSTVFIVLQFPILVQEMVLAVWLIAKGFSPSAVASLAAKAATSERLNAS